VGVGSLARSFSKSHFRFAAGRRKFEIAAMHPQHALKLGAVLLAVLNAVAFAQEPKPQRIDDLTFVLPDSWQTHAVSNSAALGVVFTAHGPTGARLTVSRLPAAAAPPLLPAAKLDPMTSPETAVERVYLEEAGLTPLAGLATSGPEASAIVTSVAYQCQAGGGAGRILVLTCTWSTAREVLRARLQYSPAVPVQQLSELEAIRGSLRFAGYLTTGFGEFQLTHAAPPANAAAWAQLAPPGRPVVASPSPRPVAPGEPNAGQLVQSYKGALIIIEGGGGSGSGFVCQMADGLFLVTNQHVASEMPTLKLSSLDGSGVPIGPGAAAVGHDIIRFTTTSTAPPLSVSTNVDADAKIGDPIMVLGNSEGARVVQPLNGTLVGIGPDRIEVTAEFVPGNSGSPIIHLPTGKVIGIATYLTKRRFQEFTSNGADNQVRRFGYRLDTVKTWQPVVWNAYRAEAVAFGQVEALTKDLERLIGQLEKTQRSKEVSLDAGEFSNSPIYRTVRDFNEMLHRRSVSVTDRKAAFQSFMGSLRASTQADIARDRQTFRYDFFLRRLGDEARIREEMYKLFDVR
jgi:hypothetical protein